jgi:hypothetical protein
MTYSQKDSPTNVPITLFCHYGGGDEEEYLKTPPTKSEGDIDMLKRRLNEFYYYYKTNWRYLSRMIVILVEAGRVQLM